MNWGCGSECGGVGRDQVSPEGLGEILGSFFGVPGSHVI